VLELRIRAPQLGLDAVDLGGQRVYDLTV